VPEFDVLVIGGGASGLRAAIAAKRAGSSVAVLSKVHPLRTNSALSPGGVNAPLGQDDSPEKFAQDIMRAGDELCNPAAVRILAENAAKEVIWLERVGVPFNRDSGGKIDRRSLGSSSVRRACYTDDRTGHSVLEVLHEQFQREQIPSFEEWFVTSLTTDDEGCYGAVALGLRRGQLDTFRAGAVVLATGGSTRLYRPCTASMGTSGDGMVLAYEAGARLMDLEMIQFHPTVYSGAQTVLISEAALAEGAKLVNASGDGVMDPKTLSRAEIAAELHKAAQNGSGPVYLDFRPVEKLTARFPQAAELVRLMAGLDITKDPVPVRPVAHRPMGGIETSTSGETSVAGLFAVGECSNSGLNGAGRLGGNTLTEAVVFGKRVGEAAASHAKSATKKAAATSQVANDDARLSQITAGGSSDDSIGRIHGELGDLMNANVGIVRNESGLKEAQEKIGALQERHQRLRVNNKSRVYNYALTAYVELGTMLKLAEVTTAAALARTESRGAHSRSDFPERDDSRWKAHSVIQRSGDSYKLETKGISG